MRYALARYAATVGLALSFSALAYEPLTHGFLSEEAARRSVLVTSEILRDYGLDAPIDHAGQAFANFNGQPRTILQLIIEGSEAEDTLTFARPLNHFYNPLTGEPLNILGVPVFIPGVPGSSAVASPLWGLAPRNSNPNQQRSYWDARQYLFDGLTLATEAERSQGLGKAFQTLGHMIHLLQDMAAPQHVRNDIHCDVCGPFSQPSLHEKYTESLRRDLPMDPAPEGYDVQSAAFTSALKSPRQFWNTESKENASLGKGIAEFTNRNFVSVKTNYWRSFGEFQPNASFPLPDPRGFDLNREYISVVSSKTGQTLSGWMWFIPNVVQDNLLGTSSVNYRGSSFSVFDDDLTRAGKQPILSLNRFNIDAANRFLLPRAVAYSAGLINYFFRGKLDLKKDEQDPAKFRIVNLGPETMNGRFALYYDARDGKRYPVQVDPADPNRDRTNPNAWFLTIAAADPALPNSNLSDAIAFIPPADDGSPTAPKAPNEYTLVFSGNMGEEREDPARGIIGAVAAKSVSAPYSSVLYLLGLDEWGQRVALRADKTGTRVVPVGEFHPLRNITMPPHYRSLPKAYVAKQVQFTQHTFGYSYETQAATVGIHFPFYGNFATGWAKNSSTGAYDLVGGLVWNAKSPDPAIGEFRFRPMIPESNPNTGQMEYRRTFRNAAGNLQTVTGFIQLPPLPAPGPNYLMFPQGLTFISADGLSVTGFSRTIFSSGNPSSHTIEDFDLRITLAAVPTLAFVKTGERQVNSTAREIREMKTTPTGKVSTDSHCQPPSTLTTDVMTTDYLNKSISNLNELYYIEYLSGALRTYRRVENGIRLASYQQTAASMIGCNWLYQLDRGESIDKLEAEGGFEFSNGKIANTVKSDRSGFFRPPLANNRWDHFYEGPPPAPTTQYTPLPAPIVNVQHWVERALTDRVEDAIYYRPTPNGGSVLRFRNNDIPDYWYIADSSPLGEVFFATADLKIVVHEPRRGPKVVIPQSVVRLLAAVWM